MPERIKLTEKVLRDAEPVSGRDYQLFDTDVRGFAACIYRGGGRAFTLDYRHAGRQRRMTFGRWPEWSVSAARERAKELRREIDAGADPLGQREAKREAPRVTDLIERYCAEHLPKLSARSAADQRSALAKMVEPVADGPHAVVPPLRDRPDRGRGALDHGRREGPAADHHRPPDRRNPDPHCPDVPLLGPRNSRDRPRRLMPQGKEKACLRRELGDKAD